VPNDARLPRCSKPPYAHHGYDMNKGEIAWQVPTAHAAEYQEAFDKIA